MLVAETVNMFAGVTSDMLGGVLDQVTALLPFCIPTAIGYIAFRKGLSFLMGVLRKA